ncbi:hypothetical protein D9M72_569770 [compost metagenome]
MPEPKSAVRNRNGFTVVVRLQVTRRFQPGGKNLETLPRAGGPPSFIGKRAGTNPLRRSVPVPTGLLFGFLLRLQALLLDLLQFPVEGLVLHAGSLAPAFPFGVWLSGVERDFPAIDVLVTLFLALQFCAQFVFGHGRS